MVADLRFYYGIDLVEALEEATTPPAHLFALCERLPEGSMTSALLTDEENWRDYLDITPHYYVQAGIYDAVNNNTAATGNWKKKAPKIEPWPLPAQMPKLRRAAEKRKTKKKEGLLARLHAQVASRLGPNGVST